MNTADSSDPFDFELTPADLKIIERQATQLMMQTDIQGTNELAGQIHELQHQTNILSEELLQLRREKPTREGEISILRQRLNQAESEKYEMCRQHVEKLETMEQARQALLRHYEREVERFQTELKFKQNEAHFTSAVKGSTIEETSLNFHSTQVMHVNSFAGTFGDLTGISKRAKVEKSIRRESSCETDSLGNPMETLRISEIGPSELELQDMLYRAMGHADFVFCKASL
jgi:DNA anti-recombination protein RmuC